MILSTSRTIADAFTIKFCRHVELSTSAADDAKYLLYYSMKRSRSGKTPFRYRYTLHYTLQTTLELYLDLSNPRCRALRGHCSNCTPFSSKTTRNKLYMTKLTRGVVPLRQCVLVLMAS